MKRKIAAVLMADVSGEGAPRDAGHAVVRDVVIRGGGRVLAGTGETLVAEFQSAVEAVRAAVDVQATLRARNKALPPAEQLPFRLGLAIGEVIDGASDVPPETQEAVARRVGLATPGGVCLSRSVRDAVVSKLKLSVLDVTVEGVRPLAEPSPVVTDSRTRLEAVRTALPLRFDPSTHVPWTAAALACGVAAFALWPRQTPDTQPTAETPQAAISIIPAPEAKAKPSGGTLEFMPAHAPDPSAVLAAKRMLPQAWKGCHEGSADQAVAACKLLLDSGIAKEDELADIHVANGRALRERHELDKALEAFSAALALAPTAATYSLRGTVHYDKGAWDKAIADYAEAIRRDPANGEAFNNRAWTYYRAGRAADALADADMAVRLLAKEAYVWDTRAHIHAKLGNRDAAISDFRAALAIDPNNAASRDGLASLGVD